jgi:hypothetical protein
MDNQSGNSTAPLSPGGSSGDDESSVQQTEVPSLAIQAIKGLRRVVGTLHERGDEAFDATIEDAQGKLHRISIKFVDFASAHPELFQCITDFAHEESKIADTDPVEIDRFKRRSICAGLFCAIVRPADEPVKSKKLKGLSKKQMELAIEKEMMDNKRHVFYKEVAYQAGWRERKPIPAYLVEAVRRVWPEPHGNYKGFKPY